MDTAMIGKIEKAKKYAEQPELMQFTSFSVNFEGTNNPHVVTYDRGTWKCECSFFQSRGCCSHTMALERVLDKMIEKSVTAAVE